MDHPERLPVAKRRKTSHSATQPNASAVARFFETPELVQILLDNLHSESIDLLALAAVCKGLRTPALQVWVRHLDLNLDDFEGKLKLLEANMHLLPHIRCLRIMGRFCPDRERMVSFWKQIKTLFSLLEVHRPPHDQGPLLDITVDVDDGDALYQAIQLFPRSVQRISALHLPDPFRSTPLEADDAADTFSMTGWIHLALLLKDALPRTPSVDNVQTLRVFNYSSFSDRPEVPVRRAAKQIFWSTLTAQCRSLGELRLFKIFRGEADYVLRHGHFTSLKVFELWEADSEEDTLDVDVEAAFDTFLDRHTGLEQLQLGTLGNRGFSLSLNQTFPALQHLDLSDRVSFSDDAIFQFVRRHSRLRRLALRSWQHNNLVPLLKSLLLSCSDTFKHLPSIENSSSDSLRTLIRDGARPLRASARAIKRTLSGSSSNCKRLPDLNMLSWSGVNPEDVQDITFLEVTMTVPRFDRQDLGFFQLFACGILPNLTELHFFFDDFLLDGEGDFPTWTELIHQIVPSTSIRVLCITSRRSSPAAKVPNMLLTRQLFPIRFELLCWRGGHPYEYFRFVADSSEMQNSASSWAPQLGKLGNLQAVPERMVLTQVGSDGVWNDKPGYASCSNLKTVLNHTGV